MNPAKCNDFDYIHFLIAAQAVYSTTEAARCDPRERPARPAHDAYTRLLQRQPPDTAALWAEVQGCVQLTGGMLVVDDSTLDKPYAHHMDLVSRQWSGKHKRVVWGINLISLVWTGGDARFPVDCRLYDKEHDGLGKNDHFRDMLTTAQTRGFRPFLVAFDSWYSSLANLKLVRTCAWEWLTQLKVNRHVDPDDSGNRPVSEVPIDPAGSVVHLKGYGLIRVFKIVSTDGDIEYWATSRLECSVEQITGEIKQLWHIEEYHRALKQFCGIERAQHRSARAQRNHISFALRAFLRLECHRLRTKITCFEAKRQIVRTAIRDYLASPTYQLSATA